MGLINKVKSYLQLDKADLLEKYNKLETQNGKYLDGDDYNWEHYHLHYSWELHQIEKQHTIKLQKGDYTYGKNEKKLKQHNSNKKAIHPNWHILYETILQLSPTSILEVGCGNGMHLNNLSVLSDTLNLNGFDLGEGQLKLLRESYPNLKAKVAIHDATTPIINKFSQVDLAYSQAVIMHIQAKNRHLEALKNMFNISKGKVVLMENWKTHDFMSDIKSLFDKKEIKWNNLFFHYRNHPVTNQPHIMICSNERIDYYPNLENYSLLTKTIK